MKGQTDARQPVRSSVLGLFFLVVFGWTWGFWFAAAALGVSAVAPPGVALEVLGLLGPMLGGVAFAFATSGQAGWRDYWRRVVDARRIRPLWWLVILALPPGLFVVAILLDVAFNGDAALALARERMTPFANAPSLVALFLARTLVYGPAPEEFGWRGYALDRMRTRWSARACGLMLGGVWALWHVPLFFIKDTLFHAQGVGSLWFWLFLVNVVAFSMVFAWVFENTGRSTLAAIVLHLTANIAASLGNVTAGVNVIATLLWAFAAVAAAWALGRHENASREQAARRVDRA